jgi:anionic cell wall polymer biosynthesis LytR-Cps2A-Psr (LCP) family protein
VEQPLKYVDKAQGLYIDIPVGKQVLNGEKAYNMSL